MPTYEYLCEVCGRKFDLFQSIKQPPLTTCPYCEGNVRRLISGGGGLLFKGSGFYATDYRSEAYKEAVKKEKESKSDET
jgi:putative FmdB family regulatory protein